MRMISATLAETPLAEKVVVRTNLARAMIRAGRPQNAEYLVHQNLREAERSGSVDLLASNTRILGRVHIAYGDRPDIAERLLWEAIGLAGSRSGSPLQPLLCLVDLVRLYLGTASTELEPSADLALDEGRRLGATHQLSQLHRTLQPVKVQFKSDRLQEFLATYRN